ncbi:hypothetical protein FRB94_001081 [Tulasnella sp. JGI-2019a]|nr:hypothetical protein FRB94_001081 [Tulasnella sp. JGI-2019a]
MSAPTSPVINGRSDDGRKSSAVESHSGRRRSRSRDRRERHRDRSTSRHRSHRDRGERDKDRDKERSDRDKDRERERDRPRDRDRERERDTESRRRDARDDRGKDRHRRSRSRGYERDRERELDRDRDRRRGDRDQHREDRDSGDRRRKRRDDSPVDADRHSDTKRRREDSTPVVQKVAEMEIDDPPEPKTLVNDIKSSPVPPPPANDISEHVPSPLAERERRSSVTSSRRSARDRPTGTRSPPYDERNRERSQSRDMAIDHPRPRSRGPPPFDDRRRYDDRDNYRGPPPPRRDPPPRYRRQSPSYDSRDIPPPDDDAEARSVFVSQLAARLTARDLGYFFEDKLGEGTVRDSRIVQDRISRRSKGIAYVELASQELVLKAIALTGTVVMGLPIMVQLTESERNKQAAAGDSLNLPPGASAAPAGMQLYVGSLHFNLTESDIKQVFEPFGELDFVDLHKDPQTGRSKGYAFVQYKRGDDAKMALEQMDGFELAGRQLRVNTVHEKGSARVVGGSSFGGGGIQQESLDEGGGTNLNNVSRQALMQKLARTETPASRVAPIMRPTNMPETQKSRNVLLKNMFDPEEETGRDWHTELEADVKEECEGKYGPVEVIKVEVESQGEIYVKFDTIDSAGKALEGLNGRWFGGRQVSATYISDALMQAHQ